MLYEIVMSGFGGQGALLIGQLLAMAGIREGRNATWMPTYGPEKRGGTAYCDVILSDETIGSPVVDEPEAVIAMDEKSFTMFEDRIVPGGVLLYNSSLVVSEPSRTDIRYAAVPAGAEAERLGSGKTANMVLLGAYLAISKAVGIEAAEEAMKEKFGDGKTGLIESNMKAVLRGMELANIG